MQQVPLSIPLLIASGRKKNKSGKSGWFLTSQLSKERADEEGIPPLRLQRSKPLFWCHRPDLIHPSYSRRDGDSHLSSLWAEVPDYKLEVLFGSWVFVLQEGFALDNVKHLSVKQVTSEKKTSPKHINSSAPTEPRNISMQFSISSPSPAPPPATAKPPG